MLDGSEKSRGRNEAASPNTLEVRENAAVKPETAWRQASLRFPTAAGSQCPGTAHQNRLKRLYAESP